MDDVVFESPGTCPACNMTLVPIGAPGELSSVLPGELPKGLSVFVIPGGAAHLGSGVRVHIFNPQSLQPQSPVLIVIPGAGRNAGDYLTAWINTANERGVLVAALEYQEPDYGFGDYHLCGLVNDLTIDNLPQNADGSLPTRLYLQDADFNFQVETQQNHWLFDDFDRVFDLLKVAAGSQQDAYDIFGHSAGGQILHRLALFKPNAKARHILAANSGFYTLPDLEVPLLAGMGGTGISEASLADSFACQLTLLLGELDNAEGQGGRRLHTPRLDEQGLGRLERGTYFFEYGNEQAARLGADFNWRIETVPNVGHEFERMSQAAASILYP